MLFVLSELSVAIPQQPRSSNSIYERQPQQKLRGMRSLESLRSMGVLRASLHFGKHSVQRRRREKTDYHSINKTNCNLKQEQTQKAVSMFSLRKSLHACISHIQASVALTNMNMPACMVGRTHACNGFVPWKVNSSQSRMRWWRQVEKKGWNRDEGNQKEDENIPEGSRASWGKKYIRSLGGKYYNIVLH